MAAVAGASPVTITVRTPRAFNSVMRAVESDRGGSLSETSPTSCIVCDGCPAATARTRKPFFSSSATAANPAGDGGIRAPIVP